MLKQAKGNLQLQDVGAMLDETKSRGEDVLLFAYPTKRGELDLPFVTVALDLTGTATDQS